MNSPKLFALSLTAGLFASTELYAADLQPVANQPVSGIQMVSGGIGDGEIDAMTAQQNNYSVKIVYAENSGEYLSNVNMQIRDKNNTLVNNSNTGPIVLLNLKPGTYTLVSNIPGDSKTQRITVRSSGLSSYIVHLRSSESQTSSLPSHEG